MIVCSLFISFLCRSLQVLSWTYVKAYNLKDPKTRTLFEFQQAELENEITTDWHANGDGTRLVHKRLHLGVSLFQVFFREFEG